MLMRSTLLVTAAFLAVPAAAYATPKLNPFTYTADTLGEGEIELEQYADFIPLRGTNPVNGTPTWYGAMQFQTEFEYGITDRLELGLYVAYVPGAVGVVAAPDLTEATGVKQRLRYRLDDGTWPIDIAVYGEVVENNREIELEAKIILQKRFGKLRTLVNLWAEREFDFAGGGAWVVNPTAALSYQVTPQFFPGVEAWARCVWEDNRTGPRTFTEGPAVYVGPTMNFNFGRFWWTTGFYFRTTNTSHTLLPDENYGTVWLRTLVGVGL